ncbi:hypothetical protein [Ramlibacter sp. AN1133]|uniref:hypothetical protein n=1 Tax=Ramlibacter sp. AN1133 TaxID=3133429 RepID=UPI0030BE6417
MRSAATLLVVAGLALAGCRDRPAPGNTAVLGGYGHQPAPTAPGLTDAHGQAIPPPPAPAGTTAQLVRSGDETALAAWVQDGHVVACAFARPGGWGEARALEDIYGQASDPQLASNGRGVAMAVWRHTVGTIESLRFSRFDAASGWTAPDVLPGALPRPHVEGAARDDDAPRLAMDAQGNVTARWTSGFAPTEEQVARYTPGQGWSPPLSEPVASAPPAAPAAAR